MFWEYKQLQITQYKQNFAITQYKQNQMLIS